MYVGHLATGLAARAVANSAPLVVLLAAAVALDLGDVALGLAGIAPTGHSTHTLPAMLAWSAGAGLLATLAYNRRTGLVIAALVGLHLPLDYLTSSLEAWPDGPTVGVHLYRVRWADAVLEIGLVVAAVAAYRTTLPPGARARQVTLAMTSVLAALQIAFDLWIAA